jgi:hypothetical protein
LFLAPTFPPDRLGAERWLESQLKDVVLVLPDGLCQLTDCPEHNTGAEGGFERRVTFLDRILQPGFPDLAEEQVALGLVEGREVRVQIRLEGPLLEKRRRKGMKRGDGGGVEFP